MCASHLYSRKARSKCRPGLLVMHPILFGRLRSIARKITRTFEHRVNSRTSPLGDRLFERTLPRN